MSWQPSPQGLSDVLGLLRDSCSSDSATQQANMQRLEQFRYNPDFLAYCAHVLILCPGEETSHRTVAGLLLKNAIATRYGPPKSEGELLALNYVKATVLRGLSDAETQTRHTSATVISVLLKNEEAGAWPEALDALTNGLTSQDANTIDGVFNCFQKICEDCPQKLDIPIQGQPLLDHLVPQFITFTGSSIERIRLYALEILQTLASMLIPAVNAHIDAYLRALFDRASDSSADIRRAVCATLAVILGSRPDKLVPEMKNVVDYMAYCTKDSDETVALEACEFWLTFAEHDALADQLRPYLPLVTPLLLEGMVYSDMDLIFLDNDDEDEAVPDKETDVKPRNYSSKAHGHTSNDPSSSAAAGKSREAAERAFDDDEEDDDDDYDDDDDEDGAQEWNIRKCSAAALDVIAVRGLHGRPRGAPAAARAVVDRRPQGQEGLDPLHHLLGARAVFQLDRRGIKGEQGHVLLADAQGPARHGARRQQARPGGRLQRVRDARGGGRRRPRPVPRPDPPQPHLCLFQVPAAQPVDPVRRHRHARRLGRHRAWQRGVHADPHAAAHREMELAVRLGPGSRAASRVPLVRLDRCWRCLRAVRSDRLPAVHVHHQPVAHAVRGVHGRPRQCRRAGPHLHRRLARPAVWLDAGPDRQHAAADPRHAAAAPAARCALPQPSRAAGAAVGTRAARRHGHLVLRRARAVCPAAHARHHRADCARAAGRLRERVQQCGVGGGRDCAQIHRQQGAARAVHRRPDQPARPDPAQPQDAQIPVRERGRDDWPARARVPGPDRAAPRHVCAGVVHGAVGHQGQRGKGLCVPRVLHARRRQPGRARQQLCLVLQRRLQVAAPVGPARQHVPPDPPGLQDGPRRQVGRDARRLQRRPPRAHARALRRLAAGPSRSSTRPRLLPHPAYSLRPRATTRPFCLGYPNLP